MNAWMSRNGVHGSSRPGLMTTGVFSAMAGSQSEFTAGELLGITRPSASHVGKNESFVPNCSPKPRSMIVMSSPRERPFRITSRCVSA